MWQVQWHQYAQDTEVATQFSLEAQWSLQKKNNFWVVEMDEYLEWLEQLDGGTTNQYIEQERKSRDWVSRWSRAGRIV